MVEFGVSQESDREYGTFRGFRWTIGLIGLLVAVFLIARELPLIMSRQPLTLEDQFNLVFFPVLIAGAAYFVFATGPGAVAVAVSDDGIELRYRSGRRKFFRWGDLSFSLTLQRYSTTESTPRRQIYPDSILTRFPRSNPISPDAFDTIVAEATRRGLELTWRKISWQGPPARNKLRIRRTHESHSTGG